MTDLENLNADDGSTTTIDQGNDTDLTPAKDDKSPSVVKLLSQRNEARNKLKEYEPIVQQVPQLLEKMSKLEEMIAKSALESDVKVQKAEFFNANPHAKELEADIEALRSGKDLTYDQAFKLVAAEKNPALLMDEQYRNKATSTTPLSGVAKDTTGYDPSNITDEDIKAGKVSDDDFLKWSNAQAKKEKAGSGFVTH